MKAMNEAINLITREIDNIEDNLNNEEIFHEKYK